MPNHQWPPSPLLGFDDAQAYLGGISRSTLKILRGRGEVVAINVNRRVLFERESLDRFIDRRREAATSQQMHAGVA